MGWERVSLFSFFGLSLSKIPKYILILMSPSRLQRHAEHFFSETFTLAFTFHRDCDAYTRLTIVSYR